MIAKLQSDAEQEIVKQQTVLKLGGLGRSFQVSQNTPKHINVFNRWDKRYLILTTKNLMWLKDPIATKEQNSILVTDIQNIQTIDDQLQQKYLFKVYTKKKNYIFSVTMKSERDQWLQQLSKLTNLPIQN